MADLCGRGLLLKVELPGFRDGAQLSRVEEIIEAGGEGCASRGNREAGGLEPEGGRRTIKSGNFLLAQGLGEAITEGGA
ncbi:MAG: hypothetical protein F4226_05180 [Synechococcus sp. SB0678_bin_12]|nr:hypothetical protein [Synechococcus sp. SB0678_bin_12]